MYMNRPKESNSTEESNYESDEKYHLKSLLDVIADSGVVETYLITKMEMQYLPHSELKIIYDAIVQVKEPDRPNTEEVVNAEFLERVTWEKDKIKKIKEVIERQKIEKGKNLSR